MYVYPGGPWCFTAAEAKAERELRKPDFMAVPAPGSVKARMAAEPNFKQAVTAWDNRRKRIEARLDSVRRLSTDTTDAHIDRHAPSTSMMAD
eukprot:COSAG01_NODE_2947_length_6810_cov_12.567342_5_plen_92_part_00